jgi:1-acyl-sn-glycerol-3-phosphate acyltransferase
MIKKIQHAIYYSWLALRSALFSIAMILYTVFFGLLSITLMPLLPLNYRFAILRGWSWLVIHTLWLICGIRYQVDNIENLHAHKNGIVMCKHQSAWETIFLLNLLSSPAIILKKELLRIPFFGWGLANLKPIAIDRSERKQAMQQILQQGKQVLDAGRWILIFPEGTRVPAGHTKKFHIGGALLAEKTAYPIIPIAHNAGEFWERSSFIKKPGTVKVIIGKAICPKNRIAEDVTHELKQWIDHTVKSISKSKKRRNHKDTQNG